MTHTILVEHQTVFKEFCEIYDRYYPLMHRKNIDWEDVCNFYVKKIRLCTTDIELFNYFFIIMNEIIQDEHSYVTYKNNHRIISTNCRLRDEFSVKDNDIIPSKVRLIGNNFTSQYLSYGTLIDDMNIGYIKVKRFEHLTKNFPLEFKKFKIVVDEAMNALKDKKGIIIDIKRNPGGQSLFCSYLAGRFITNTTPIDLVRKRVKIKTGSTISSLSDWIIKPFEGIIDLRSEGGTVGSVYPSDNYIVATGPFQFDRKIALLTSKETRSISEYFVAAMKSQNRTKIFGTTTAGVFAGTEIFFLRNGGNKWLTRLSVHDTELFYNGRFQSFEGIGIPPDNIIINEEIQLQEAKNFICI